MTDRIKGFQVTLENDMRSDDAEMIQNAIAVMRNVCNVKPII